MIHPQVPLRIPCYDLTLLTDIRFEFAHKSIPSSSTSSDGLTGGVCKEQGHIHRGMLTRDYYGIHFREGELQPSVQTTTGFQDYLPLSGSDPIVPTFVARVLPGRFGAYGPTVDLSFLHLSDGNPFSVPPRSPAELRLEARVSFVI